MVRYKGDQEGIRNSGEEPFWENQAVRRMTYEDNVKMDRGVIIEWI